MTGIAIRIETQGAEDLQRALDRLAHRASHLQPALKEMGEHLLRSLDQRFDAQKAPDGTPWEDIKPATREKKGHARILTDHGYLRRMTYLADRGGLEVGPAVVRNYAAIHQLGGEAGRRGARFTMPARPYLGLSRDDRDVLLDIARDYLAGATS